MNCFVHWINEDGGRCGFTPHACCVNTFDVVCVCTYMYMLCVYMLHACVYIYVHVGVYVSMHVHVYTDVAASSTHISKVVQCLLVRCLGSRC